MRTVGKAATALALAGVTLVGSAGAAWASCGQVDHSVTAAAAVCSTPWGSGTETSAEMVSEPLTNIRTGQHDCYDRVVFDIPGAAGAGYDVGYVSAFYQDGTGQRIPVTGGAVLQIFVNAPSYNIHTGAVVYPGRPGQPLPGVNLTGYRTFKDTKYGSSYEGRTQVAVGVRARLPFRVLQYGDRVVVDVAHTW